MAEFDIILYYEVILIILGAVGVFFAGGVMMNPILRAKVLSVLKKKEIGILALLSKDNKGFTFIPMDLNQGVVTYKDMIIVNKESNIYRQDQVERGFALSNPATKKIFGQGTPFIFASEDSLTPLSFHEGSKVSPKEMSANLLAWVQAKTTVSKEALDKAMNQMKLLMIICFVTIMGVGVLVYFVFTGLGDMKTSIANIEKTVTPAPVKEVVITQTSNTPPPANQGVTVVQTK